LFYCHSREGGNSVKWRNPNLYETINLNVNTPFMNVRFVNHYYTIKHKISNATKIFKNIIDNL